MFNKILVPLDGSAYTEAVLEYAERLAQGCGAQLVLLRVGEAPHDILVESGRTIPVDEQMGWLTSEYGRYLDDKASALRSKGLRVETVIRFGKPEGEIIQYAEDAAVDVIAVASHGRLCVGPVCFSDEADNILRQATRPVLLVKIPEGKIRA